MRKRSSFGRGVGAAREFEAAATMAGLMVAAATSVAIGVAPLDIVEIGRRVSAAGAPADRMLFPFLDPTHRPMVASLAGREGAAYGKLALCFTPDTADTTIAAFERALRGPFQARFNQGPRWGGTALDPSAGAPGDPKTITYSFVPDGTLITGAVGEPDGPSDLFARMRVIYNTTDDSVWQAQYHAIFQRWQALTGLNFVYEPNDDGAALNPPVGDFPQGQAGVRGDVRLAGHLIDGNSGILAYNYYPSEGDMVVDTGDNFFNDVSNNSLRLRNVLAHEHGHGMGQAHVCTIAQTKLMEPFISTIYDGPRHDDIRNAHAYYGDVNEPDDTASLAVNAGALAAGNTVNLGVPPAPAIVNGATLSIDAAGDIDWTRITIPGPRMLSVSLTPQGLFYEDAPQSCSGNSGSCCFGTFTDSLAGADLRLEVIASNGVTVLASANANPAGQAERIVNLPIPAAGDYYLRVSDNGGTAYPQLYTMAVSSSADAIAIDVSGLPALLAPSTPAGFNVSITSVGQSLVAGSPTLFWRRGSSGGFTAAPLTANGGTSYTATIPAQPCGGPVQYYVQAQGSGGFIARNPAGAPATVYSVAIGADAAAFADDFETDRGWTVSGGATAGQWERVEPVGNAASPELDTTPLSGVFCYVTQQNAPNAQVGAADLDGGSTVLTSPTFSLAGASDISISYSRWFTNNTGASPNQDVFTTEISSDNGGTWTTLETAGPTTDNTAGWQARSLSLSGFPAVARTAAMRLRFTANDLNPGSVVEAGVDDVRVLVRSCVGGPACVADVDDGSGTGVPDGGVGIEDLLYYLGIYDAGVTAADVDDGSGTGTPDGGVGIEDLLYYLARYDAGC